MKKLIFVLALILSISLVGCGKQTTSAPSNQEETKIKSPIVGTWKYYADIPKMAYYQSWTLVFKEDGTFETMGDDITMTDEITKTGKNVSGTWGPKGIYTISEDNKNLVMTRTDENRSTTHIIEFKEEEGVIKLMFMEKSGEVMIAGSSDKDYYLIFNKQK